MTNLQILLILTVNYVSKNFEFSRKFLRFLIENYSKIAPRSSAIFACPAPFVFQQNSPKNWANFRLKFYWDIYQQTNKICRKQRGFSRENLLLKEFVLQKNLCCRKKISIKSKDREKVWFQNSNKFRLFDLISTKFG